MMAEEPLANVSVAVLAGGRGTRLAGVLGDLPKVLAPVGGSTVLDHLLARLRRFGARRVVLCLGYQSRKVIDHIARRPTENLVVEASVETEPLGTGGAIALARPLLGQDAALVINGDTLVDADLGAFAADFYRRDPVASVLCVRVDRADRYGRVDVSADGWIERFREKDPAADGSGLINAGAYLFGTAMLDAIAAHGAGSLETDILERQQPGRLAAFVVDAPFIDIGTPESLIEAQIEVGTAAAGAAGSGLPSAPA